MPDELCRVGFVFQRIYAIEAYILEVRFGTDTPRCFFFAAYLRQIRPDRIAVYIFAIKSRISFFLIFSRQSF